VIPFDGDHVPIDQRALGARRRARGLGGVMGVVEIGSADGQHRAQDDSEQDSHGNLLVGPVPQRVERHESSDFGRFSGRSWTSAAAAENVEI